jgi:hypothetical protein
MYPNRYLGGEQRMYVDFFYRTTSELDKVSKLRRCNHEV